jgi:hypothetical protein
VYDTGTAMFAASQEKTTRSVMQRKLLVISYIDIVVGFFIAAVGAYLHWAISYHERAYAVFFVGIVCMVAVVMYFLWKERQHISSRVARMASYGLGGGAVFVALVSLFLLVSDRHRGVSAAIALSAACLLALYIGAFLLPLVSTIMKKEHRF